MSYIAEIGKGALQAIGGTTSGFCSTCIGSGLTGKKLSEMLGTSQKVAKLIGGLSANSLLFYYFGNSSSFTVPATLMSVILSAGSGGECEENAAFSKEINGKTFVISSLIAFLGHYYINATIGMNAGSITAFAMMQNELPEDTIIREATESEQNVAL